MSQGTGSQKTAGQETSGAPLSRSGSWIGIAILLIAAVGGVAIYYLRNFEHYRQVSGLEEITIDGARFAVSDYQGLDHQSWPQRLRGCFRLKDPEGALALARPAVDAVPYAAPSWFECWDAEALHAALKNGAAKAVIAESRDRGGFVQERVVAIFPDGRAYQWRRQRDKSR